MPVKHQRLCTRDIVYYVPTSISLKSTHEYIYIQQYCLPSVFFKCFSHAVLLKSIQTANSQHSRYVHTTHSLSIRSLLQKHTNFFFVLFVVIYCGIPAAYSHLAVLWVNRWLRAARSHSCIKASQTCTELSI